MASTTDLQTYIEEMCARIEVTLDALLPMKTQNPGVLYDSMRYSLFAGGKRLRPVLTLATVEALGGDVDAALPVASTLEMIHTYSLIHDDLPCMDDDDLRRGMPTNHKVYGEATALLAGDALLTHAFQVLGTLQTDVAAPTMLRIIGELAKAAGAMGMVAGQMADMENEGKQANAETLAFIHANKTGALLTASVRIGALFAGAQEAQLQALTTYAQRIGLAFQIQDDILDVVGETEKLGKVVGADAAHAKSTYPVLYGLDESREMVRRLTDEAHHALQASDLAAVRLHQIADWLVSRDK
ncbi:polyprenyl synthetase family protein [Tumebacillus permanentifrigoris]|uniref:Farnesyl diphosphate synthase n=1 Tax=Tumebacillus permanentifrigoris TaxID=378543 RepID=A0A316D8W4_9BACL|nr:farnesyl diphosphate synthase [Tumebacillus permanentifrigoris]PWK11515.1 farnesyl-diphosphate synthase [Tumebacillus permanentifrigoris]